MAKFWSFLGKKSNREILGWAGGGLVVAAAGLWAVVTYIYPSSSASATKPVNANCGVAVGGNVSGSIKSSNVGADCAPRAK